MALGLSVVGVGLIIVAGAALLSLPPDGPRSGGLGPTTGDWGPLAVSESNLGGDAALASGRLVIGEDCVFLEGSDGQRTLLVWWSEQTRWDAATRRISFKRPDGTVIALEGGRDVRLGGSGTQLAGDESEPAVPWDSWLSGVDWVAPPAEACETGSTWSVGDVLVD